MHELKDPEKKNLNPSFSKLDNELSRSNINQSHNENDEENEEEKDIIDTK